MTCICNVLHTAKASRNESAIRQNQSGRADLIVPAKARLGLLLVLSSASPVSGVPPPRSTRQLSAARMPSAKSHDPEQVQFVMSQSCCHRRNVRVHADAAAVVSQQRDPTPANSNYNNLCRPSRGPAVSANNRNGAAVAQASCTARDAMAESESDHDRQIGALPQ